MSPPTTYGTPARLQIAYAFEPAAGNDNQHYLTLAPAAQRTVRSSMGALVRQWFPVEVRDEWLMLQIPAQAGGSYPVQEALTLMAFKVQDPRITRSDLALEMGSPQVVYNIHDDVQCSSIKVNFIVQPSKTVLSSSATVNDTNLAAGSGTFEARFQLELKWEVPLTQVVL